MKKTNTELKIGNLLLPGRVLAAPMAGVTDRVFRAILREQGASFCYTEMVCAKALLYQNRKTHGIMDIHGEEDCCGIQLFGAEPDELTAAAQMAVAAGAPLIDINMGCPMAKIVGNREGAALLLDIPRARRMVEAVAAAVPVPVTVKLRRGFEGDDSGVELAKQLPDYGAAALTMHGRYRSQYYEGHSDWDCIRRVKQAVKVPVFGNGDIFSAADAERMTAETGCDGVMIGRGLLGNPWLLGEVQAAFAGARAPLPVPLSARMELAIRHLEDCCALYGEYMGVRFMRKFLGWYLKGFHGAAATKNELNHMTEAAAVAARLRAFAANSRE